MLPSFELLRPTTVDEVLDAIDHDALPYSGGTELLLAMRVGLVHPRVLIDLKRIPSLATIENRGVDLRVGSSATHCDIAADQLVSHHAPLMAAVARRVGNARVRAQGTIGGNVCFAEPKSDVTAVLAALDATVEIASSSGTRVVGIMQFLEGAYATTKRDNELVTGFVVPLQRRVGIHVKYQPLERPTVGVVATSENDGSACRLVIGAVAECPSVFDFDSIDDVRPDDVASALEPLPDIGGNIDYKRRITSVFVERGLGLLRAELP